MALREYEASPKGERGAFLRREGLYSSHINTWRSERSERDVKALQPLRRGPKPKEQPDLLPVTQKSVNLGALRWA
jgi:hypothetical protein